MTTSVIRDADWVIAWDPDARRHVYRRGVDLAWTDGTIAHVGPDFDGPCDVEIDGSTSLLVPGLIDVHSHPSSEPLKKGFREEFGNPQLHMSPLYDRAFMLQTDDDGQQACCEYALCELLRSGVTSVVDLSMPYDGWLDTLARSGMRAWAVPMFASSHWATDDGHSVRYVWDEARGHDLLDAAVDLATAACEHPSGRLSAMLGPAQIDTCTEELLLRALEVARGHGWRLHTHASQSLVEFQEMTRRTGTTPVQWADDIGLLGSDTVLAHVLFTDEHSWTRWPGRHDRDLLAGSGTHVAHCPGVFSRNGQALEDVGGYVRAGISVGIGTDSFPHNMLEEMRVAAVLGRVVTGDVRSVTTAEILHAATVGGADLVGRSDLGRLAPGCAADVVRVDLEHPLMQPVRDPLRSLVYTAADRAVRDVWVDGAAVVTDGEVVTLDFAASAARVSSARDRAEDESPRHHHAGRHAREVAPLSLPMP